MARGLGGQRAQRCKESVVAQRRGGWQRRGEGRVRGARPRRMAGSVAARGRGSSRQRRKVEPAARSRAITLTAREWHAGGIRPRLRALVPTPGSPIGTSAPRSGSRIRHASQSVWHVASARLSGSVGFAVRARCSADSLAPLQFVEETWAKAERQVTDYTLYTGGLAIAADRTFLVLDIHLWEGWSVRSWSGDPKHCDDQLLVTQYLSSFDEIMITEKVPNEFLHVCI
ncbi:uncharacterized protein LOC133925397 [Phragmites australis]|uniref:uncharacterized protein LOC133925397 n=1 Tax=Phragmites australis TaxID=29695 RepID=UPI002D797803|nr:uncharacterized protein LOC133925397 [Phragmites australis]